MTWNALTSRWAAMLAALAVSALAIVALGAQAGAQSISSLTVGSGEAAPGEQVTVDITAEATDLGAWRVRVEYDSSLVSAEACEGSSEAGAVATCSIDAVAPDTVLVNGAALEGISGEVVLGRITFEARGEDGISPLTVDTDTLSLAGSDEAATALQVTPENGSITVGEVTTPGAPPGTGDGSYQVRAANIAVLALAALGVLMVAAGGWAVMRARRGL